MRFTVALVYFVNMVWIIESARLAFLLNDDDTNGVLNDIHSKHNLLENLLSNLSFVDVTSSAKYDIIKKKQVWDGIEVFGFGGSWKKTNLIIGKVLLDIDDDIKFKSTIKKTDALKIIKKHLKSRKSLRISGENLKLLVIENDSIAKLVYKFDGIILKNRANVREFTNVFVTVDASTGKVIEDYEQLLSSGENVKMKGVGGNIISGKYHYGLKPKKFKSRLLNVTKDNDKCKPENPSVIVSTAQEAKGLFFPPNQCFDPLLIDPFEEQCDPKVPNSDATNTSYSQVHDALYLATTFLEILEKKFNDTTLKSCCTKLKLCVHFPDYEVSFFDYSGICETYYGRAGDMRVDMVSPSIVGHELGHVLIACTSELEPKEQSGAIMESFCDLCGVLLGASLNKYKTDWKIGGEVTKPNDGISAIRWMKNPPADGVSIDHFKDFDPDRDIHLNAGIFNKAIFLLTSSKKWSLLKTFRLFLHANKFYWQSQSTFREALCNLKLAAKDLGLSSMDVEKAFKQVGVTCVTNCVVKPNKVGECMDRKFCKKHSNFCNKDEVCCFKNSKK